MEPFSIGTLAMLLSIASSVKNLMSKSGGTASDALDSFKKHASSDQLSLLSGAEFAAAVTNTAQTISTPLLAQLAFEAQQCEDKHISDRQAAAGSQQKLTQSSVKYPKSSNG